MSDLSIVKGDIGVLTVTVQDSNDVIFDLTGFTMTFSTKELVDDDTVLLSKVGVITSPATGVGVITLTPAETILFDTGKYRYDVVIKDVSGDLVYTVIKNSLLEITDSIPV